MRLINDLSGNKSPPQNGRVEITYGTITGNEGQGIATQMARQLVQMARETEDGITVLECMNAVQDDSWFHP